MDKSDCLAVVAILEKIEGDMRLLLSDGDHREQIANGIAAFLKKNIDAYREKAANADRI